MNSEKNSLQDHAYKSSDSDSNVDDWEEWEDASVSTPIQHDQQVLVHHQPPTSSQYLRPPKNSMIKVSRHSTVRIKRLRSRQRQKAQNARAGISLITDMTVFDPHRQLPSQTQMKQSGTNAPKFSDPASLRALEGEPSSALVGKCNQLKRNKSQNQSATNTTTTTALQHGQSPNQGLSPDDRPIMIGISVTPRSHSSSKAKPYAAHHDRSRLSLAGHSGIKGGGGILSHHDAQPSSFWSPDTPTTIPSSFINPYPPSSLYSQAPTLDAKASKDLPPVPTLPKQYKTQGGGDGDYVETPYTLFEEDGISPWSAVSKTKTNLAPDSASSPSRGWWDHIVSPFFDKRMTFSSRKHKLDSPQHGGKGVSLVGKHSEPEKIRPSSTEKPPIVRIPIPRHTSSSHDSFARPWQASGDGVAQPVPESLQERRPKAIVTDEESLVDYPPPYSSPKRPEHGLIRYRAVFPPGHSLHSQFPPSPNLFSSGLAATMTSQGATQMTDMGESAPRMNATSSTFDSRLPARPLGTFRPPEHFSEARGPQNKVERSRRRHEKEDMMARRVGGFWRGRGCFPSTGCYGRTGREGRKKRRVCLCIWTTLLVILMLVIFLSVVLPRHRQTHQAPSIWVNLTDFPPMPTGVVTIVGGDNTRSRSVCTEPTTLWSCSLPKDDHESVAPYRANQPTVILQIQWDNSTEKNWRTPNSGAPIPVARRALMGRRRASSAAFKPDPAPADLKDMWFLGETTDGIVSDQKAGEPTPFYMSILKSMNETIDSRPMQETRDETSVVDKKTMAGLLPKPDLDPDGTPAPAVMLPNPVQQPVRLFDRGLDTEHYGFYTYFKRSLFLKSVTTPNSSDDSNVPLDEDGGCRKSEAKFVTTWGETRLLVRIWTRKLAKNTSSLLHPDGSPGIGGVAALRRPGTMPWPVTLTLDTHGGEPDKKFVWQAPMDDRLKVLTNDAKLLVNDMGAGGTWINPHGTGDIKYGGFDGGSGGCECEWVNWV